LIQKASNAKMTKTLYLVRHGETLFNALDKVQGSSDSPLTDLGIKQGKVAGEYFEKKDITFDHAYTSTQERATDTMELVTDNQMPYVRLKALKEMNFGLFEGEPAYLQPEGPESFEHFYANYGGETAEEVRNRIYSKLFEIMSKEDHKNVLAVSHNGVIFFFLQQIWHKEEDDIPLELTNGGILVIEFTNEQFNIVETIDPMQELGNNT